jgi:voltage-gated sodium channel
MAMTNGSEDSHEDDDFAEMSCAQRCKQIIARGEAFITTVIILNVVVMAMQTDAPGGHWPFPSGCGNTTAASEQAPGFCIDIYHVLNGMFLLIFSIELVIRFIAFGCKGFFCSKDDWYWNLFDFTIVTLAGVDYMKGLITGGAAKNSKMLTILRALRILRILRVTRLLRLNKKLRILVTGLGASIPNVFWIFAMLLMLTFISAIFCTQLIGNQKELWGPNSVNGTIEAEEQIEELWGTVAKSMLTLFQILTMDNWVYTTNQIYERMPWMYLFFDTYVVFGAMVILSMLTGVMAEQMNEVREEEDKEEEKHQNSLFDKAMEEFHQHQLQKRNTNEFRLNKVEFQDLFNDEELVEKLEALKEEGEMTGGVFTPELAGELFECFDVDDSGYITWDEFQKGLFEVRKGLQPKHVFELRGVTAAAMKSVKKHPETLTSHRKGAPSPACETTLKAVEGVMDELEKKVMTFETLIKRVSAKVEQTSGVY